MSVSHHYALTFAVLAREQKSIEQLLTTMESFTVITNPFNQDSGDLFDLVTKAVMLENVKKDVCEQSTTGRKFFQSFVKERTQEKTTFGPQLRNNSFSLRRQKVKKVKRGGNNNFVELQEDRNLFARMMVACTRQLEIDIQEAIGTYEFFRCAKIDVCN